MTQQTGEGRVVWESDDIARALRRIAHQILESNRGPEGLLLLGIPTRGVQLARRLGALISEAEGCSVDVGELDITMYRDDLRLQPTRQVGRTHIPASVDNATVVLVDEVLNTGRTIVSAMEALKDIGRPHAIRLAVLVDRGHREVPIHADHVGKDLPTRADERVLVRLSEPDGEEYVKIMGPKGEPA